MWGRWTELKWAFLEKGGFSRRHHQNFDEDEESCYCPLYVVGIILG